MAVTGDQWVGVRRDGSVWGWNASTRGRARSVNLPFLSPQRIVPGTHWIQSISTGCGAFYLLSSDGALWAAGENGMGELGNGSFLPGTNFTAVTTAHRWRSVAASSSAVAAIATNGTLWIWGLGRHPSPVQVGNASNWVQITRFESVFTVQNSEGDWAIWNGDPQRDASGRPTRSKGRLTFLPNSSRWSTLIPAGRSIFTRTREGNSVQWGLSDLRLSPQLVGGRHMPEAIELPDGAREVLPLSDFPGTILAWTSDGTLWAWGAIPGAICQYSRGERLRIWIVDTLNGMGIDRPGLRNWAIPVTVTTRFIPIARFVAP